jgi:hypothetical protein
LASTLREEYNEAAADLEINEDEEAMLMALIEYDKTIATYARKHGLITPIQLLDRAVSTITALITERISNYFLFDHKKASLESMKAAWVEIYKAHYEEIKAAKQSKKLRELAAAEANISRMENYNLVKGEDKITQMQTLSGGEYF